MGNCPCFEGVAQTKRGPFKVCICGGAGEVGQHLALLMATNSKVKELSVYDIDMARIPAAGVAADLSHLEFPCSVKAYSLSMAARPVSDLPPSCLQGCSLVLVQAGIPRKPGQEMKDLVNQNANIAKMVVEACAKHCPEAVVALLVNPVNSVVPAMAELYEKKGLDPKKIVGITTLDVVRANKFVFEATGAPVDSISVPVVGGTSSGKSVVPVFSREKACLKLPLEKRQALDARVQNAGTEVIKAKNGKGSATLSTAYAAYLLGSAILDGLSGKATTECAYVKSNANELPYFASPVTFGPQGVAKVHGLPPMDSYEKQRLSEAKTILQGEIQLGLDYAAKNGL
eukprot:TRINITY_DN102263_c0_g1_i1.p1 TRINITY_DN102263_c0_g1~~TRINITY_DN102263_c0_g1_i1.p1  ORF type:complete len:343 (+),score=63.36 TRINITY_DN102263_c0_g1_i1:50-1078(+)